MGEFKPIWEGEWRIVSFSSSAGGTYKLIAPNGILLGTFDSMLEARAEMRRLQIESLNQQPSGLSPRNGDCVPRDVT